MREARIDADMGRQHTETVRPDDAQQIRFGGIEHGLTQGLALGALPLPEPGGDHDGCPAAARAELTDKARDRGRRSSDYGEVGRER